MEKVWKAPRSHLCVVWVTAGRRKGVCNLVTNDQKRPKTEDHKRPLKNPLVRFKDGGREALTGHPRPHKARYKQGLVPSGPGSWKSRSALESV